MQENLTSHADNKHTDGPTYPHSLVSAFVVDYLEIIVVKLASCVISICLLVSVCLFCLFDLILYVPSTIFQLNRDGSSWVEPELSYDKCVLLKDHNTVTPVRLEPTAPPRSQVKHFTTEPLRSLLVSVAEQAGLNLTWSETMKTDFVKLLPIKSIGQAHHCAGYRWLVYKTLYVHFFAKPSFLPNPVFNIGPIMTVQRTRSQNLVCNSQ